MSSASTAEARAPADTLRALAMAPLLVYAVLSQLDAIGNKLSAGLPIGTTELTLAALLAMMVLIVMAPSDPSSPSPFVLSLSKHVPETRPLRPAGEAGRSGQASTSSGRTGGGAEGTHDKRPDHDGARLVAMLYCWAVFCWTLSAHRDAGLDYLVKLAVAILPALGVLLIADRPQRLLAVVWAMIGAGAVSAAIVIVESRTGTRLVSTSVAATTAEFEGVARSAGGSDQNPTTAAQMLLTSTLLAGALLFSGGKAWRVVLAGVFALGALALVLASARSALIGLALGVGLVALSFRRRAFFPLLVVAGVVAMIGAIPFLPPTLIDRFTAIGDFAQDQTLYRRITYLRIGADLIAKSPVWGVGPGNFPLYYITDAYRWMPGRELFPRELHNTYLDTATEYGLVGFAIFAALLLHALTAAWRATQAKEAALRHAAFAIGVALAGLLVACFFMPHKDMRYLWLTLALAIQAGRLARKEGA
jgi:O-antigen ligase